MDRIVTFIAPTFVRDKPVERIAKFADSIRGVEWYNRRPKNHTEVIDVPAMTGFIEPSLDTMKPEVGPNTSRMSAKGS